MTQLRCRHGQRDASGYDFWYEGLADDGQKIAISASRMRSEGKLLLDRMDAQEWADWFAIQVPYEPRVPSPRKWGDGTLYNGRTLAEQQAYAAHERARSE